MSVRTSRSGDGKELTIAVNGRFDFTVHADFRLAYEKASAPAGRYVVDLAENVSPASLADTKRLVYEGFGVTYPDALEEIDTVQYAALDRIDAKEGAAALIEKRPAQFPRLGE